MLATPQQSATVPVNYLPVREAWLNRCKEPILDPMLPIIDPHHHLWDRPGWRYLLDDLLNDTNSGHNILATVFIQARSMYRETGPVDLRPVGETEFVNGVAAMSASGIYGKTRICAGIVGHADLTLGNRVEPVLAAHMRAGGDRFRGIRHITAWDADSSVGNPAYVTPQYLLADEKFREGFVVLSRLGLSFDAWLFHPQIDELASLARAFPDARIVLNHVGGPIGIGAYAGQRQEVFARWAKSIKGLATCENVYVNARRTRYAHRWIRLPRARGPAFFRDIGRCVAPLYRNLHRGVRIDSINVREQLPGRQGLLRLCGVLECMQVADQRRF